MPEQPDPTLSETIILPAYCVEVAEVLTDTENHPDPTVRAIRKIVTQAALALQAAYNASGPTAPHRALPAPVSTSTAGPETHFETFAKPKRKSSAAVLLMAEHQVAAVDVRAWARTNGLDVADRGGLPVELVQQYLADNHAA